MVIYSTPSKGRHYGLYSRTLQEVYILSCSKRGCRGRWKLIENCYGQSLNIMTKHSTLSREESMDTKSEHCKNILSLVAPREMKINREA